MRTRKNLTFKGKSRNISAFNRFFRKITGGNHNFYKTPVILLIAIIFGLSVSCQLPESDGSSSETKTFKVVFDSQGGSTVPSQSFKDSGYASEPADPLRTGYAFGGWFKESNCTTLWDFINDLVTFNITLYAKWTGNSYTVTFDKAGGTGGANSVNAVFGSAMPSAAAPVKTGNAFDGYYDGVNGTGIKYYNSDMTSANNWDKTANTTLYAKWAENVYTVIFNKQGGTGGSNSVNAVFANPMPSATAPARTGFTFDGYYAGTNGTGTKYYNENMSSARDWDKTATTTLYAKWNANIYTVTFDKAGGTGGSNTVTVVFNSSMPSAAAPSRTGCTFDGYYDGANGTGYKYYNSDMSSARNWDKPANTTLYAKWTANSYTVTFNKVGGAGGSNSVIAVYGSSMPAATAPAQTGYTFDGYYDGTDGTGYKYYNSDMTSARNWDKSANTTLYAKWTANVYLVTFDKAGGEGGSNFVYVTYGEPMPLAIAPTYPADDWYAFDGYYIGANGTGTKYYNSNMTSARNWDIAANTTLRAKWIDTWTE
ncbi:MAG: InlB B-repeat-containing protein [Spirochaetes bacterium]|nr:InlB B-repeat-containing protein [Spirochaetota bacterium]